jgi:hypothetical protein
MDAVKMRDLNYMFSIDLKSKKHVKNISISDEAHDRVFLEGDLGKPVLLSIIEEMLELEGTNGVIRMTMRETQLQKVLSNPKRVISLRSKNRGNEKTLTKELNKL